MNVSIVIPNWNGRELLVEYFQSVVVAAEEYRTRRNADIEIILVDDASTDESVKWLRTNYTENDLVKIVELENNGGFLHAVNKGFKAARFDLVFLLNSDVRPEPGCLEPLTKHFSDPDVFAVSCRAGRIDSQRLDGGGKIGRFERGFWRVFLNYEAMRGAGEAELISFYGSGGYTMYHRAKWEELRGFQEILSPNYWEDVEICYRAWKRGWKVIYEPDSRVKHLGSASMKKKSRAETNVVAERNRLLFTWINLHDHRMLRWHVFWLSLKLIAAVVSLNWNYLSSFKAAVRKLSKVKGLRSIEKQYTLVTDRELAQKFAEVSGQPGIFVVATKADEAAFSNIRNASIRGPESRTQ